MKVMKITDTHYGFSKNTHRLHEKFLKKAAEACAKENIDVIIHAGDWISNCQHQFPRTLKMFRNAFAGLPILTVKGNHDLWDYTSYGKRNPHWPTGKPYHAMMSDHNEWMFEHDIWHLEKNPYHHVASDIIVYGFDGYYRYVPPNTNDPYFMPREHQCAPMHSFLQNKAHKDLDWILLEAMSDKETYPGVRMVCVTHHQPFVDNPLYAHMTANPRYMEMLVEYMNVLCVGHSHNPCNFIYTHPENPDQSMRVINSGCDFARLNRKYDAPIYMIFEI